MISFRDMKEKLKKHNALQIPTENPNRLKKLALHKMRQGSTCVWSLEAVSVAVFEEIATNWVCGKENNIKGSTESRKTIKDSARIRIF